MRYILRRPRNGEVKHYMYLTGLMKMKNSNHTEFKQFWQQMLKMNIPVTGFELDKQDL